MGQVQWIVGFVVLIALIGGLGWFIFIRDDQVQPAPASEVRLPASTSTPTNDPAEISLIIGEVEAPITITKYGDFKCPICKRFFDTTEPELIAKYIDTGRAKIHFVVDTHIGQESIFAGEGAYCAAEQGKFRDYHDFVYRIQGEYDGYTFDQFKTLVRNQLEFDRPSFDSCMDAHRYKARVEADHAESGRVGGHTTPTFVIGKHKISGAQPLSIFDTVLRTVQ